MTQERVNSSQNQAVSNYYTLLGLKPAASVREIRQAYRELSKLYHPDTTELPAAIATEKFRTLNEAYATLSSPDRRLAYDHKIGYSRVIVSQPLPSLNQPQPKEYKSSAYLDPTDRALSAGELFALFILGITFLGCLILALTIGITRGEKAFQPLMSRDSEAQDLTESEQSELRSPVFVPKKAPTIPSNQAIIKQAPKSDQVKGLLEPAKELPKLDLPESSPIRALLEQAKEPLPPPSENPH